MFLSKSTLLDHTKKIYLPKSFMKTKNGHFKAKERHDNYNVPNFALGHNVQITFSMFMKVVKGMPKVK